MSNLKLSVKESQKKTIIKGFIKTSLLDWRGRISCVIFFGGCNFRCPYCHNKELVFSADELPTIPFYDIKEYIVSYNDWLDGVVISGGEPCLNEDLPFFCERIKKLGMQIKLDTNGSRPQILSQLIREGLIDYVAMDFKAPLNEFGYRRCTGVWPDIKSIGQSIELLLKEEIDYEFRVTVCNGLLNKDDIRSMGEIVKGAKRFVLQNFVPQNTLVPSFAHVLPFAHEKLEEMKDILHAYVQEILII